MWGNELLKDAHAQKLVNDGSRLDVAVRTRAGDLISEEIQYSQFKKDVTLRRYDAHRKVALALVGVSLTIGSFSIIESCAAGSITNWKAGGTALKAVMAPVVGSAYLMTMTESLSFRL